LLAEAVSESREPSGYPIPRTPGRSALEKRPPL
jgi:hypothetical protein